MKTIVLPDGHKWFQVESFTSSENLFQCDKCGALFLHDMIDDSEYLEGGNGNCDEEIEN